MRQAVRRVVRGWQRENVAREELFVVIYIRLSMFFLSTGLHAPAGTRAYGGKQ